MPSKSIEPILPPSIENFGFPLCLAFSKNGNAYLSERITGRLWQIDKKHRLIKTFPIVPLVGHHETGLLGIALDPNFEKNRYVYCYYTYGKSEKDFKNRVVRIKDDGTDEKILLDNIPAAMIHNGGIIAFAPDKTLYIGTGVDNPIRVQAQNKKTLNGKVLRINRDGTIPKDNPFPNSAVYSYGHRNIFGLAFHPKTGKLYICDVGPSENDEINIIKKGGNYGWPHVTGIVDDKRFVNPIKVYEKVITPTQSIFVDNHLYFASFNEGTIHKLTLKGRNYDKVEKDEIVYQGKPWGIHGVFYGPDKQFYLTTQDKIIRFIPERVPNPVVSAIQRSITAPKNIIQGKLGIGTKSVRDLKPGEGAIVKIKGESVAAYKKNSKEIITLSPVCTHRGCIVGWNNNAKTWDCPCHGSRYSKEGTVIRGPAEKNLDKKT